jgi:hypothetical protein
VPAAAAVVVVLAAGGGLTGVLVSGGGGGPKSSTSAASAPNAAALPSQLPVAEVASGFADDPALDSAVRQLVTGALPTAPAGVAAAVRSAASAAVSTSTAPPETAVPVTSAVPAPDQLKETTTQGTVGAAGTVPSAAGFPARAEPGGAAPMAGAPGGGAVTSQAPGLGPTFTGPGLTSCLQRLGQGARVRGVAVASYRGKRSLVVVFATANPHLVDVYVVGPGCDAAPPDGIRTIRLGVRVG